MAPPTEAPPVDPAELDDRVGAAANGGEPQPGDEPPQEPAPPDQPPEQPAEGEPDPAEASGPEIVLEGSGQLSMNVGGKRPTSSELKLQGGSIGIDGQFSKGEILVLRMEVRVGEVAFVDTIDSSTGQPTASTRRHKARVLAATREA